MLDSFLAGLELFFQLENILWLVGGVLAGVVIGALPGLGPNMVIALLLPLSFVLPPIAAICLFMGVYKGGIFGGSISAILFNMPGTGASAATVMDGYPLTQKGESKKALQMALYGSVFGDTFSDFVLLFFTPLLAGVALKFGPPEFFAIMLFSLTVIGYVSGKSIHKGILMGALGVFLSIIGIDPVISVQRYTLGLYQLAAGIPFVPMVIGLFAFSEVFIQSQKITHFSKGIAGDISQVSLKDSQGLTFLEFKQTFKTILRSSFIGTGVGILPGLGAGLGAWVSYGIAKRFSKKPEEFGQGSLEGVAAAESANNAVCGANLIPLLALGIPGSVIAAFLLGALTIYGIRPGPRVFLEHGPVIYAIIIGIILANGVNFVLSSLLIKKASSLVTSIPLSYLIPGIIVFAVFGSYSINSSLFDVGLMLFFAILGYFFKKFEYPIPPLIIGFILGPMAERGLRQALIISEGSFIIFFQRPIALTFILITILSLALLIYSNKKSAATK